MAERQSIHNYEQKPEWLHIKYTPLSDIERVEDLIKELGLNTVCAQANCPNYLECFSKKVATFMILGTQCSRNCRFCNVTHGMPHMVDADEPIAVAKAVAKLGLTYVVITSVTRDDLPDGGARHFASVIKEIRAMNPNTAIETLIPDFRGDHNALSAVAAAKPDIISHNIETVSSLYETVRPQAQYLRSLNIIGQIKKLNPSIRSKSGLMVGLGETKDEVLGVFQDLRDVGCDFLTVGQYLSPSKLHLPVYEYITPAQFDEYGELAKEMGFLHVASGPLVRSSYHADEAMDVLASHI